MRLLGEINECVLISDSQGGRYGWDWRPLTDSWRNQFTLYYLIVWSLVYVWVSSSHCEGGRSASLAGWLGGWTDGCMQGCMHGWMMDEKMDVKMDG